MRWIGLSKSITVVSKTGRLLYPCSREKAEKLVDKEHAEWLSDRSIVLIMTKHEKQRIRNEVLERDDYICQYCGAELDEETATVDHVIPKSKGGSSYPDNMVCSCQQCNLEKGNMMPEKFQAEVKI